MICNAGVYQLSLPYSKWSADGHEQTMQTNYLSHFLMTRYVYLFVLVVYRILFLKVYLIHFEFSHTQSRRPHYPHYPHYPLSPIMKYLARWTPRGHDGIVRPKSSHGYECVVFFVIGCDGYDEEEDEGGLKQLVKM